MFKRLENKDVKDVLKALPQDVFSTRIKANLSVYLTDYSFAEFWAQYADNGEITAVISKINGCATLSCCDNSYPDEIKSILKFIGCSSLFLDKETAEKLKTDYKKTGDILIFQEGEAKAYAGISDFADMKEAFSLINENEGAGVIKLDYLEWLSDFTYKKNRNAASLKALIKDNRLVSFAMTSAETENAAIISGVFTDKNYRNNGYGERVLLSLAQSLKEKNKKVYIMTAEEKMTGYYEKRGFVKAGVWSEV